MSSGPHGRTRRAVAAARDAGARARRRLPGPVAGLIELVAIVAVALALAEGVQAAVVKPFRIPSGSMEPTLEIGQRVLVDRLIYDFHAPRRGEIVVFHPPDQLT